MKPYEIVKSITMLIIAGVLVGMAFNLKSYLNKPTPKPTQYDIVKFCQDKAAAQLPGSTWGYKGCIEEFNNVLKITIPKTT